MSGLLFEQMLVSGEVKRRAKRLKKVHPRIFSLEGSHSNEKEANLKI